MINCNWSHSRAREDQIVSGLKRPANGKLVAGPGIGQQADKGSAALRLAALCGAAAARVRRAVRRLAGWAAGRAIAPNSLTGISLLLALCAAAWFSGGPGGDSARGLIAMGGWLLVMAGAGRLAAFTQRQAAAPSRSAVRAARVSDDSTDWLVLPDVIWDDEEPADSGPPREGPRAEPPSVGRPAGSGAAGSGAAGSGLVVELPADDSPAGETLAAVEMSAYDTSAGAASAGAELGSADAPDGAGAVACARGFGWLSAVCAVVAECAIYGGMAAGARPTALIGMWPLAVMTVISVAVTELLGACRVAAVDAGRCRELGRSPARRRWTGRLLCPPAGVRALLAAAALAAGGPQAALFTVLAVEVFAFASTVALLAKIAPPGTWPGVSPVAGVGLGGRLSPSGSAPTTARNPVARVTAIVGVTGKERTTAAVRVTAATAAETGIAPATATAAGAQAPASQDVVLALRDDGRAARWAGRLVQGNLIPLPPALAGLIATAMLAALGLRGLPGFIAMTPPVVMMLAAPGSSHPHDGRFDWLVPVLLALAQYVYLGALGFALGVPGPAIFSLCAMTFLWYASITAEARRAVAGGTAAGATADSGAVSGATAESGAVSGERNRVAAGAGPGPRIGWETRLFVAGLAATFGLATFGYLGLATYLGVLICRKVLIGYLVPREEDRR